MHAMKTALTALTLGISLAAGTAQATGPVSDVATATANIVFSATGTATAVITPVSGLVAGSVTDGTVLANAVFTASTGDVAWRWTPGTYTVTSTNADGGIQLVTVTGKAGNKLNVSTLSADEASASTWNTAGWWLPVTTGTKTVSQKIVKSTTQTVPPDSYPLSMDAVVWGR